MKIAVEIPPITFINLNQYLINNILQVFECFPKGSIKS